MVVQPGDTLWSIAQSAAPNADARTIVQEILQANRLTTANITAGQRLWVPRGCQRRQRTGDRDTPAGLPVILCGQRFQDPLAGNLRRLGAVVYGNHNI